MSANETWIDRAVAEILRTLAPEDHEPATQLRAKCADIIAKHAPDIPEVDALLKLNNQVEEKSERRRDLLNELFARLNGVLVLSSELARLEKEATPGPWDAEHYSSNRPRGIVSVNKWLFETTSQSSDIDAALVVALRNAAPSLIAEVQELRARRIEDGARVLKLEAHTFKLARWIVIERNIAQEAIDDGIMVDAHRERVAQINSLLSGSEGASYLKDLYEENERLRLSSRGCCVVCERDIAADHTDLTCPECARQALEEKK